MNQETLSRTEQAQLKPKPMPTDRGSVLGGEGQDPRWASLEKSYTSMNPDDLNCSWGLTLDLLDDWGPEDSIPMVLMEDAVISQMTSRTHVMPSCPHSPCSPLGHTSAGCGTQASQASESPAN